MGTRTTAEAMIQTLTERGWRFRETRQVEEIISTIPNCNLVKVESELINLDMKSFGAKSLPDSSLLRKISHLDAPLVLQVTSARDVLRSCIDDSSLSSHGRRLLRLRLTDGHSEIVAIEYSHIPSLPDDVVPGTKILVQKKAPIHNGIVCLNSDMVSVLGGVVQSFYEEWQMNRKYSGSSRAALKLSQNSDLAGPPPFEKLQTGKSSRFVANQGNYSVSTARSTAIVSVKAEGKPETTQRRYQTVQFKANHSPLDPDIAPSAETAEERPSNSERPKEVVEAIPIQNQAAAQKLLDKMSQPSQHERRFKVHHQRGKEKEEDSSVMTLNEWERRKAGIKPVIRDDLPNLSRDEDLARQLQSQFDLEDYEEMDPQEDEARNIKASMFNFDRGDQSAHGTGMRGRGKGRGRGRGRRGGRGRFH